MYRYHLGRFRHRVRLCPLLAIEYAPYVENGHRQEVGRYVPAIGKRLVNGFVEGRHMLREGLFDLQKAAPDFIKTKSEEFLSRMMEGK